MDFVKLLNTLGGILGVLSVVVTVIFGSLYFGKKAEKDKDTQTIDTYKENDLAKTKLLETKEREVTALEIKCTANDNQIKALETTVKVLNEKFTQAPSIAALTTQIGKQHAEMMKQMGSMTKELGNIAKALPKAAIIKVDGNGKEQ